MQSREKSNLKSRKSNLYSEKILTRQKRCDNIFEQIRRGIEAVITRRSWKPFGQKPHGFESHPLRQKKMHGVCRVFSFHKIKWDSKTWLQISRAGLRLAEIWEKAPVELSIARGESHPLRQKKKHGVCRAFLLTNTKPFSVSFWCVAGRYPPPWLIYPAYPRSLCMSNR